MSLVLIDSFKEFNQPRYRLAKERYHIASFYCENKAVMDIACNAGYGTGYLARVAEKVYGFDILPECIGYANEHWKVPKTEFAVGDILTLPVTNLYNAVVSLETIEHLKTTPSESIILLKKHIESKGLLILSFPENEQSEPNITHQHTKIQSDDIARAIRMNGFQIENVIRQGDIKIQGISYNQTIIIASRKD